MFDDPAVRRLTVLAAVLVILFLVGIVSALVSGVLSPGQPRTRGERDTQIAQQIALESPEDPKAWSEYIRALVAGGQLVRAQAAIDQARDVVDQTSTQELSYLQAALHLETGRYKEAIELADQLRGELASYHEAARQKPGSPESRGAEISENYWRALIVQAEALEALGMTADAVGSLDLYLEQRPTAADVLVRRGDLKESLGDLSGAEADYRAALVFLPNDQPILDRLDRIGADR